ncbi:MAG: radical SAM protein [Pseudomonadota bacterium]
MGSRKKVLLINTNTVQSPYPVPPLGICLLAEALKGRYEVLVFDGVFGKTDHLGATVADFSPDYVGMGIRNIDNPVMRQPEFYLDGIVENFAKPLRELTNAPLILGGSGYSLFPRILLDELGADYGVVGEGEKTFLQLLTALDEGGTADGIPGVLVARGRDFSNERADFLAPANIPFSNIDKWVDFSKYRARSSYPIQTKRGCHHRCVYCTYPTIEGAHCRMRSPKSIVDEIGNAISRLGDVTFEFVDSVFNDPPGHAEELCRELIRRSLGVRLRTMGINPRGATSKLFELMKEAGFSQIDCTPDSACPRVIEALGKGFTKKVLIEAARGIKQSGLPTMWFFLFGGPGETEDSLGETLDFIDEMVDENDLVYLAAGLRIYPGTSLHQKALNENVVKSTDSLLVPQFYVSQGIGPDRLYELIVRACSTRANCIPAWESTPSEEIRKRAMQLRAELNLDEPMFRSFLRARRELLGSNPRGIPRNM